MLSTGTRLAVSVAPRSVDEISVLYSEAISTGADLVEVRLDALRPPEPGSITDVLGGLDCARLMLTYRSREEGGLGGSIDGPALDLLEGASDACPGSLMDAEISGIRRLGALRDLVLSRRDSVVVSRHYAAMLSIEDAASEYHEMADLGRYVKLVFPASSPIDNLLPISLYNALGPGSLISFCTGVHGTISRLMSAALGAPIAYTSLPGRPLAEGQLPPGEFASLVEAMISSMDRRWRTII
ncbi:3-dehydroquinate dehydratase I [Conexivisphaera calida]|uniref:3-dehydroquinate dehydratase n=1 Tax=Conexivisphaera calida TaxID=1874277 RepID=A0A4V0P1J6_9ARCH|nr:3-dehydroquinate dehydratase I [Conexivisphaera calida]